MIKTLTWKQLHNFSRTLSGSNPLYRQAERDIELLTGIRVSAKTQERIVERSDLPEAVSESPVAQAAIDGGMVRLVGEAGAPSEWKQYKAIGINASGPGMAYFQDHQSLLNWLSSCSLAHRLYCLGDGHAGIWSLFAELPATQGRQEILDWFHLIENLYKVGGSVKRLAQAKAWLWQGQVEQALALFEGLKSDRARRFCLYLQTHRHRIVNYDYYQSEGLPIGSGAVESWIKQIDARVQIAGARWKPERVPQMLKLRCAYLNEQLDLFSLTKL
jgi:hypothetical protein